MRHKLLIGIIIFAFATSVRTTPPQTADALWQDARKAYEAQQYAKAQQHFDQFTRRHSADERAVEARVYIALCAYHRGRKAQSVVDLNRIAGGEIMHQRRSRALLLALDHLAVHYRSENRTDDWRKTVDQLHQAFPDATAAIRETRLWASQCLDHRLWDMAESFFSRIEQHLTPEDRNGLQLARIMQSDDGGAYTLLQLANAQLASNAVELAARLYDEALKRNPTIHERQEVMTRMGWCLYLQDKTREAERLWQQAVNSGTPGDRWRGQSRWHLIVLNAGPYNKPAEAIRLCEIQAHEFEGEFMGQQALLTRAWLYWTAERWGEALAAFEDLCNAHPEKRDHPPIQEYIRDCEQGLLSARARQR